MNWPLAGTECLLFHTICERSLQLDRVHVTVFISLTNWQHHCDSMYDVIRLVLITTDLAQSYVSLSQNGPVVIGCCIQYMCVPVIDINSASMHCVDYLSGQCDQGMQSAFCNAAATCLNGRSSVNTRG